MKTIPRLMIAAIGSGSGKTTLTCALLRNFYMRGRKVVAFKCGPDYIDPMFHKEVLHTPSYNLDVFMMGKENCTYLLEKHTREADIALIEGVMGFYDGLSDSTQASSYELAYETKTPVVLVVSCKGMGLSIVPLLKGFIEFRKNTIQGVILNDISSMSYVYYKNMIEKHTSLKVYGFMPHMEACSLESRHLGLITAKEVEDLANKIEILGKETRETIDFDGLINLANSSAQLQVEKPRCLREMKVQEEKVKIGIAKDKAFSFYYEDNLELLESLGAELVPFSPMEDKILPEGIQGLILGGGYPEIYSAELAANHEMKSAIYKALQKGMPCMAECGGFMYLQEKIKLLDGTSYEMVGYLKGEAFMTKRLIRFGYMELECERDNILTDKGEKLRVHEFHYSDSTYNGESFISRKPYKQQNWPAIIADEHIFAGYPHIHFYNNPELAKRFIEKCSQYAIIPDKMHVLPNEIEKESFRMIEEILGETVLDPIEAPIIKRAIHTSADFDYAKNMKFSQDAVTLALAAIKNGACIVTDTQMAKAGINKTTLKKFGMEVFCFVADEDVAAEAKEKGITRSAIAVKKAISLNKPIIFAIGNAPTALIAIADYIEQGILKPELVIGVPVGFVNVVESKELIMQKNVPYIVARGRKGGSNVAAAICNSLLYMADNRKL